MATYYVDKRVAVNGNGSQASPWKSFKEVSTPANTDANPTIEVVEGSGPYYRGLDDFGYAAQENLYLALGPNNKTTVTFNFNKNVLTAEIELFNPIKYEWRASTGKPGMYYCTGLSGINPSIPSVYSAIIDNTWLGQSTNAFYTTTVFAPISWGYGNFDSLAFNTMYVKGINPNEGNHNILASVANTAIIKIAAVSGPPNFVFNDGILMGGGRHIVETSANAAGTDGITFNRCIFSNSDSFADNILAGNYSIKYNYCKFLNCGHEAFSGSSSQINKEINNCEIENCHTVTKLISATLTNTITIKNCKTKNILAGCIQHNTASTQTLVENNNQWHVDPVGSVLHGGDIGIAFATAGRKWTTTDVSDYPPSQATNTQVYVAPETVPEGSGVAISGLHDQAIAAKDINGKAVLFLPPNIGRIDGRKAKIVSSTDYAPTGYEVRSPAKLVVTGGGDIDLSGLTDTGAIDVIVTAGSTIKSFTGNGALTSIRGLGGNRSTGKSRNF